MDGEVPVQGEGLRIEVLGGVRVTRRGERVAVGGPVDRAVLGLLALDPGREVPVADLLVGAYGGLPHATAKRALHSAVWRLRRALGPDGDRLRTVGGAYVLDLPPGSTDVDEVRAAVDAAARAAATGDHDAALRSTQAVLGRLPSSPSDLPPPVRRRLLALGAEVVEVWAEALLALGRGGEGVERLVEVVGVLPGRHRAEGLLVEARRAAGATRTAPVAPDHRAPEVLDVLAVLGSASMAELWAVVRAAGAAADTVELLDALAVADGAGLLAPGATDEGRAAWREPSLREERLAGLSAARRRVLHAAAADGLSAVWGEADPGVRGTVADHLLAAVPVVEPGRALDAAAAALDAGTDDVHLVDRALAVLDAWCPADAGRRARLLLAHGDALEATGATEAATATWEGAAEVAAHARLARPLARAALALSGTPWRPRTYPGARTVLEGALDLLDGDDELRTLVTQRRIQLERSGTRPDDATAADVRVTADRLALAGVGSGPARAAIALYLWVDGVESGSATLDDDPEVAAVAVAGLVSPTFERYWRRWSITRAAAQDRLVDAEAQLIELAELLARQQQSATTDIEQDEVLAAREATALQLALLRFSQGRPDEAAASFAAAGTFRRDASDEPRLAYLDARALSALLASRRGDRDTASRLVEAALVDLDRRPRDRYRFTTAMALAYPAADLGAGPAADMLMTELDAHLGRHCVVAYAAYAGAVAHALARLHAAAGDVAGADDLFVEATSAHEHVGAHAYAALSRHWRAVLHRT